ncbi:MAG: TonB-dependent receptor [Clostridiales bacterium]|nr:TonB-dependent receptor [Clostridiales bacterium]
MKFKNFLVIFLAFVGIVLPLLPQEKHEKPEPVSERYEVVVTATRLEIPAREAASSVTVIPADELERWKRASLLEVLRDVAGLFTVQSGGPGAAASAFIRGANSEHTLVLVDGVELNDPMNPSRSFDLAHLTLENIERVEILRGPQSPLYGSDALGGVVSIITKKGAGKPRATLASSAGSYGTFINRAGISGSAKNVTYSFGLQHSAMQGVSAASSAYPGNSENDNWKNFSFSGRLGLSLGKNVEVDLSARSTQANADVDNFGGPYGDDPNNVQDYESILLRGQIRGLFLDNRWEQKLAVSLVDSRRTHNNLPDENHPFDSEEGRFESRYVKLDWQNNFFIHPANTLTVGVEHEQEEGESEYLMTGYWGSYASDFPLRKARLTGIYIQDYVRWADRLFASAGLRYDHHSQAGEALTFRVAPAYIFQSTGTKLKTSLGTGFKAPSLYQLYAPGTYFGPIGNSDLRPEKSLGWDIGFEQPFIGQRVRLGLTYFNNRFKNLITYDSIRGYMNIGKAESRGVEVEVEARPTKGISLNAAYTRLEARDKVQDADLLRRPRQTLCAALSYAFIDKWSISLSFNYTGKRKDIDYTAWPAREVVLPGYSLLNGIISCDLSPNVGLFVRLDNIFDTRYETIYGYAALGFSAYAGVKLSL